MQAEEERLHVGDPLDRMAPNGIFDDDAGVLPAVTVNPCKTVALDIR